MAIKMAVSAESLYNIRPIAGCEISPDGKRVAFSVQRVDAKTEKKYSNLWVAETGRKDSAEQYTFGDQSDHSPLWSPDGQWLAFLSNRGDSDKPPQLYLIPTSGGEARPITYIEGSISSVSWSPDGTRLLCCVRKTDPDALERREDAAKKKLGIVERHITRVRHKFDGAGFLPSERWHIWTVDVKRKKAVQLTDGNVCHEQQPTWSPDGEQIAFVSNRADDPDFNPGGDDIYIMPADGGEMTKLAAPLGSKSHPAFSPDGKHIAYYAMLGRGDWWQHQHLWTVSTDGDDAARSITGIHDFHVGNSGMNDTGGSVTPAPIWSTDGKRLTFPVTRNGNVTLHSIAVDSSDLQTVMGDDGMIGAYGIVAGKLAYWHSTMDAMGEIKVMELVSGRQKRLSKVNVGVFGRSARKRATLPQVEEVWFKGAANNDLQGWIMTPPDFDPSKKHPSIMEMHGGPLAQYSNAFMHEFNYLACNGYVVYFCNPRGGRGYGKAHAKAIWNDHGGADVDDIMAWADYVADLPYIDRDRRGMTGGSYGGFLVNWIIGHTDQFAAAVTQRSISNRTSSYGSSDINWLREITFDDEPPWENLENYWRQSPLKHIGNAKTPTLVIHSEQDLRCPIEQGGASFCRAQAAGGRHGNGALPR